MLYSALSREFLYRSITAGEFEIFKYALYRSLVQV